MLQQFAQKRVVWFTIGALAGAMFISLWPKEQALAVASDRSDQFSMATCQVNLLEPLEAIFVLDFLTGSLKGATLSRQGTGFTSFFFRNLPADFGLDPKKEAKWVMVTGQAQLQARGNPVPAQSVVYVGELTTGKIICYGFTSSNAQRATPPQALTPVATFPFREPDVGE